MKYLHLAALAGWLVALPVIASAQLRFSPEPEPNVTPEPTPIGMPEPTPVATPRPAPPAGASPVLAASSSAALGGTSRIAFVDVELVIENSRALRKGLDAMDEQLAARAAEIDRREREFRRLRMDLDRQERLITPEERERRRGELVDRQDEINRLRFDFEEETRNKERLIEPVLAKIMNVVADVAERDKIDLVLRGEVVIYGSHAADLTDEVIAELDSREHEMVNIFSKSASADDRATSAAVTTNDRATSGTLGERPVRPRPANALPPLIP